ncbi:TetR/AcrR family transcriptional regulator [Microtetraspora malaysiensis]|uniref:TetR/AcrR family transcriptional regulator n=1 Tax=Microtetraspora malaysiensis TaxID=161358 RepID=UPI0008328504|nr:TetR/AcrR family transcriptional regulator [Microtetraspora malaysiensis]
MPRPRSYSETDIAAAALAVIDHDGLAALTMRAVAVRLGLGTMSLYRYVSDREQLEGLVVDLVLSAVDTTPPPDLPWDEQLTVLVERVRAAAAAHPQAIPLALTHRHTSANVLRWAEAVLGVLTAAGFTEDRRAIALRCLLGHLIGSIQMDHLGPLSGAGTEAMARLSPEAYPLLAETAREAREVTAGDEFRRGFRILLLGLRASLDQAAETGPEVTNQ